MGLWGKEDPEQLASTDKVAVCPGQKCGSRDYAPFATLRTVARRGDQYVSVITGHYMQCARCGEVFCTSLHSPELAFWPHARALAALGVVEPPPQPEYQHSTEKPKPQAYRGPLTPRERKAGV